MLDSYQRYKCKDPRLTFIENDKRQKYTFKDQMKVIKLYLENNGIRSIARLKDNCAKIGPLVDKKSIRND